MNAERRTKKRPSVPAFVLRSAFIVLRCPSPDHTCFNDATSTVPPAVVNTIRPAAASDCDWDTPVMRWPAVS